MRLARISLIVLLATAATLGADHQAEPTSRPVIRKLGTIACDLAENTPIVFRNRLYCCEYVPEHYPRKAVGESGTYFRMIDIATGQTSPPFAHSYHLCSAYVEGDTAHVFGVERWGADKIAAFRSQDLRNWQIEKALDLPGWSVFNTSVCKGDERYVMAIEVGGPREVTGVPFTVRFAQSHDLKSWRLLPEQCVYAKDRYTSCPTLRFCDGYYYLMYCEELGRPREYATYLSRSKDLMRWESSPFNPMMKLSEEDRRIADHASLTEAERQRIAKARNVCNSDMDLCEFEGHVVLYYCWGNQNGIYHLAEARYDGTLAELLQGFFPAHR
jgi:hypothetical protein